eukprot:365463-Chlamydomonas_euryale.AAC.4
MGACTCCPMHMLPHARSAPRACCPAHSTEHDPCSSCLPSAKSLTHTLNAAPGAKAGALPRALPPRTAPARPPRPVPWGPCSRHPGSL